MKTEFEQEVLSLRVDKDSFKNDMDSPIPRNERPNFKGLNYFPPDRGYRVFEAGTIRHSKAYHDRN